MLGFIKANPLLVGIIALAVVVFIVAGFSFLSRENEREEGNLRNQGAVQEQKEGQDRVLNKIENAARPVTGNELRDECLRNNRNPAACN